MKDLVRSITKKEWIFWLKILVAFLILTSLSRIFILIWTPDGYIPRGNTIISFVDRYVYLSYIEQVRDGAYLFEDLYTSKEESIPMLNVFWLGAGLFAKITGLSGNTILEILRILLIPLLLLALYFLLVYFIEDVWQRKLVYILSVFAGGLGIVLLPFLRIAELIYPTIIKKSALPIDIDDAGAFIFSTGYYSAHFIFSTTLFILIIILSLLAVDKKKLSYGVWAGIAGSILLNFHPFTFAVAGFIFIVYFLFLLFRNREQAVFLLKYFLIFFLFVLPSALYHFLVFFTPWSQNQIWHSNTEARFLGSILIGYGLLLVFTIYALVLVYKKRIKIKQENFLLVWALSHFVLIFLPVSIQGRFLEGYSIMLAILSSYGIVFYLKDRKWIIKSKVYALVVFILLFGLSFLFLIFLDFRNIYLRGNLTYMKSDSILAMKELKNITTQDNLILADIYNANIIPGIAVRRVFVGHGVETIDYKRKYSILKTIMSLDDKTEIGRLFKNNKIDYLFYDENWQNEWVTNPDEMNFLEKKYDKDGYKIYQLK